MDKIEKLLSDELRHTQRAIASLKETLAESSQDDSSLNGERSILSNEQEKLAFLEGLQAYQDPMLLRGRVLAALEDARKQHQDDGYHEMGSPHPRSGQWWHSLETEEYLSHLCNRIMDVTLHEN
jgi:hypothetical protein